MYWININRDIETTVKSCHICQEHQPAQQHETLLPHEIPSRPWEVVGADMVFFNDADWLIIADYYSKFPIVRKMPKPWLSSSVVSLTKEIFSETGVPSRVVSDNGPHFARVSQRFTFCQRMLLRSVKEDVIPACDVFTEISMLKRLRRDAKFKQ